MRPWKGRPPKPEGVQTTPISVALLSSGEKSSLDFLSHSGFLKGTGRDQDIPGSGCSVSISFLGDLGRKGRMGRSRPLLPRNVLSSPQRFNFHFPTFPDTTWSDRPSVPTCNAWLPSLHHSLCFLPSRTKRGILLKPRSQADHATLLFKALLCLTPCMPSTQHCALSKSLNWPQSPTPSPTSPLASLLFSNVPGMQRPQGL